MLDYSIEELINKYEIKKIKKFNSETAMYKYTLEYLYNCLKEQDKDN